MVTVSGPGSRRRPRSPAPRNDCRMRAGLNPTPLWNVMLLCIIEEPRYCGLSNSSKIPHKFREYHASAEVYGVKH